MIACGGGKRRHSTTDAAITGDDAAIDDGDEDDEEDDDSALDDPGLLDGALDRDSSVDGGSVDGATGRGDGAISGGDGALGGSAGEGDGGTGYDAAPNGGGDSGLDGSAEQDAGGSVEDSGTPGGSVEDSGTPGGSVEDSGTPAPDTGSGCDVDDPRFGCGTVTGGWVHFPSGIEIDQANGLIWSPVYQPVSDDALFEICQALDLGGLEFFMPTVDEVRTLVAGCPANAPGGSCRLASGVCIDVGCGADSACNTCSMSPPHPSGGYCRPELVECTTLWTRDGCDDLGPTPDCPVHRHWYYAPAAGHFALADEGSELAGRCVARVPAATQ